MIDWYKTETETGFNKEYFDKYPKSSRLVWRLCDICGDGSWVVFNQWTDLCYGCSHTTTDYKKKQSESHKGIIKTPEACKAISDRMSGEKHFNYGKKLSEDKLLNMSNGQKKHYQDHPEVLEKMSLRWKKYYEDIENRIKISCGHQKISREKWDGFIAHTGRHDWYKAIYLNEIFKGCHRHHITETIVVCIPAELHNHIKHNLKTGEGMAEMNITALQYINGCYDD